MAGILLNLFVHNFLHDPRLDHGQLQLATAAMLRLHGDGTANVRLDGCATHDALFQRYCGDSEQVESARIVAERWGTDGVVMVAPAAAPTAV